MSEERRIGRKRREELETACGSVGCRIMQVGRVWVIASIDGVDTRPGLGVYDSPESALRAAAEIRKNPTPAREERG